ncbi:MAG: DUF1292 domain-containing protein [Firmicutes bacterium]|nr:DUF1292 domain-containing protein [Bacillota bacterium]
MKDNKGCNCNHNHDHNHDGCNCDGDNHGHHKVIHLTLEDNSTIDCTVIGEFDVDKKNYIALLTEDERVFIYEYKNKNDKGIELLNIENEDEFNLVSERFNELFNQEEGE